MSIIVSIDAAINEVAGRQHGAITSHQLRGLGVGRTSVSRRLADGRLVRILPHVYLVGPVARNPTPDARWSAAVLSAGDGAELWGPSAASRHGVWPRHRGPVHVHAPHVPRRNVSWIAYHRSTTTRAPGHVVDDIEAACVSQACIDCGRCLTPHQLAHVLYQAAFRGVLDTERILGLLGARGPGVGTVRGAMAMFLAGSAGTRSTTEDYLLDGVICRGLPVPVVNQAGATGVPGLECDFVWPASRLVVEVDGRQHADQPSALIVDPERDAALRAAGWRVLRFTGDEVWRDRGRVVARIATALGATR
jgi:hypothetical protein